MRIFLTKKSLQRYVDQHKVDFSQANSNNAAKYALHYYVCYRTLDWWRKTIDEAEKDGNKYMSLAEGFLKIQEENDEGSVS